MSINSINGNTLLTSGSFPPVRVASTGSPLTPTTGGLLTVDGITLIAGDRVLCKDETNPVNNGIYAASTGPWVRTNDAAGNQNFFSGMAVTVALGAVNAGLTYICTTTDDPVVIGASLLTFAAQSVVATATQSATSTTSLTIGTGSKSLTIQSGKAFLVNQWVLIQETSNAANQMLGQITSYSGGALVVNVSATGGSGTHADWTIVLTNSPAAAGFQPPTGTGNVTGPGSSTTGHLVTFADTTGKVLSDSGVTLGSLASLSSVTAQFLATSAIGFGVGMLNGTLVASVAASALTIAVKTLAGADPSSSDPVYFLIRDASAGYVVLTQTAALNIVVPSGATLGTQNAQANRIWVGVFNNSNTPVLGVYNSLNTTGPTLLPWNETLTANGTSIGASSPNPQVWYTASSISAKNFRIIGHIESTQATAGTWASSPSLVQLFGPGVKKPGDVVQELNTATSTGGTTTSTTFVALSTGQTITITPTSAANLIRVEAAGTLVVPSNQVESAVQLSRGNTAATNLIGPVAGGGGSGGSATVVPMVSAAALIAYDVPNTTSGQLYAVQGKTQSGTLTFGGAAPAGQTIMTAREIQI